MTSVEVVASRTARKGEEDPVGEWVFATVVRGLRNETRAKGPGDRSGKDTSGRGIMSLQAPPSGGPTPDRVDTCLPDQVPETTRRLLTCRDFPVSTATLGRDGVTELEELTGDLLGLEGPGRRRHESRT